LEIRIVDVPPGEAPATIRRAWVGLVLPLAGRETGMRQVPTSGVLSGPKTLWDALWRRLTGRFDWVWGYVVDPPQAIAILGTHAPEAAAWWEENSPPMRPWKTFVFYAGVCEEL
jgi:hypothetical protein